MNFSIIKLALRNVLKSRMVTIVNIVGLTIGLTVSVLIFSYVRKEKTTDDFLPNNERIYAITNNGGIYLSQNMVALLKQNLPEVEGITYCSNEWSPQVYFTNEQNNYKINNLLVSDSCFFRVFQFEPIWGDPANALNSASKIVLTQSLSQKLFGDENPVGKTIEYNATYLQNELLEIGAVIRDLPQNSSWDFEAVISLQTNYKIDWYVRNMESWGTQNYRCFCLVKEHVLPASLAQHLSDLPLDAVPESYKDDMEFGLFPFNEIYFDFPKMDILKHGNPFTLTIIQIICTLILLLACINYINLVTAQRGKRYKKVGIIKVFGSSRSEVVKLFGAEAGIVLFFSILLSLLFSWLLLERFNNLTSSRFTFPELISGQNLLVVFSVLFSILIITGVIPGYVFSKHKTSLLLKGQTATSNRSLLRNGLLVFQFAISIALISSIFLIHRQNNYMNIANLGFQKENILYAMTNEDIEKNIQSFKNELRQVPGVEDITFSKEPINRTEQNWGRGITNNGVRSEVTFAKFTVTPNFFDFFGIRVKQGESFNEKSSQQEDHLFNETAMQQFGITDYQQARIDASEPGNGKIIGVVEDFNFESMHVPIRAAGFMSSGESDGVVYLKINAADYTEIQTIIQTVEKVWNKISPRFQMELEFLDSSWKAMYAKDKQFQEILGYAVIISLLLSCLGLIGLTFFVMEQRTKEIGIRKVNGAKISEVMIMLNRDFVKWVAIAFVIATPIAWYAMHKWLQNFAYKTELSWWIFALAGIIALGVALITVSWQSWRAATRNPVEALRYE